MFIKISLETIYHHNLGYEQVRKPEHHRASRCNGLVYRHIVIYEEYYKCCVLRTGQIHHINGIKDDNRIENLQLISATEHNFITHSFDRSSYKCSQCDSVHTRLHYKNKRPIWHWWEGKILCSKCHRKKIYKYDKVKNDKRFIRKDMSDRKCSIYLSKETRIDKRGYRFWSKGDKEGEYICSKCIKLKHS